MSQRDWDEHYAGGPLPWDTGAPDPSLVELLGRLPRGRALEIGCGTGTNAVYLAGQGYQVVGVDLAPRAVALARARAAEAGADVAFHVVDVLADPLPGGPYDLVFDRGCLHVFDEAADRARFAEQVASALAPGGQWLSLAGSTEGPARDGGPPRRSAGELVRAIEPHLEILELRRATFDLPQGLVAMWICRAGRRAHPAQPSSRYT